MQDPFDTNVKEVKKTHRFPTNPDSSAKGHFPRWLHREMPQGKGLEETEEILQNHRLHTVCEEAKCPNRFECFSHHTATFLALGKECTRACGFCAIDFAKKPKPPEEDEPERIAESVEKLKLTHVVITMVARDDLEDGGALHLTRIIRAVRARTPNVTIELLTSDFQGNFAAIDLVLEERPEIFNYNIETVRRLTPRVRHKATYDRTLAILRHIKGSKKTQFVKSGLMVGLGEEVEEVKETLRDLKEAGCELVTIGQYLQAMRLKLPVQTFVTPEQFKLYEDYGHSIGIHKLFVGPFIRSSYNAGYLLELAANKGT